MKGKFKALNTRLKGLYRFTAFLAIVVFGGFIHREADTDIAAAVQSQPDHQALPVLLNNSLGSIPFKDLSQKRILSINTGFDASAQFDKMLRNYAPVSSTYFSGINIKALAPFTTLVIQLTSQSVYSPELISFLREAQKTKEIVVAGFGNSMALQRLDEFGFPVVWNPGQGTKAAEISAQILFGGIAASGRLAQNISAKYPMGAGFSSIKTRLTYVNPEEVGIIPAKLKKVDDIVEEAIRERATPGAVVMVVKDGNVIFNKGYGTHTYEDETPTTEDDIFDVASVTKIASTTVAAMKLFDDQKLDLNEKLGSYLPEARATNKNSIPVKDVMLHQAGFVNLDFVGGLKPADRTRDSSYFFPVKVADHYFVRRNYYQDVMWPKMLRTPLPTKGQYVYSDISMFVMKEIVERRAEEPLDKFVLNQFYKPLGMRTAGYNPLRRFNKDEIVPTERDTYFRKTLLQGYVHDSGASLVDGVSGHAGLFASANDLAILNQMLLNGGSYGGVQYLRPETIELFTARQSSVSRRGYGFDRGNGVSYPSRLASADTYGHTGYTGTCVWVDPKNDLIYIFLSNRVYPSASSKLNSMRIRPRVQDAIYSAIAESNRDIASLTK